MTVEEQVRALVAEHSGVTRNRLSASTRLCEDAGLDGEDANEFFVALATQYDVELSALWKRWDRHFGGEQIPLAGWLLLVSAVLLVPLAAGALGEALYLTRVQKWVLGLLLLVGEGWLAHRLLPRRAPEPIRIADVVAAVERGRW